MTRKPARRRPISYRIPKNLEAEFDRLVERSGLSISAFLTQRVFGQVQPHQVRRPPIEKRLLAQMLAECAAINDQLKSLEPGARVDMHAHDHLSTIRQRLNELRSAFFLALGRKP